MTDYGKSSGLKGVTVCHMHTEGEAGYTEAECEGKKFSVTSFIYVMNRNGISEISLVGQKKKLYIYKFFYIYHFSLKKTYKI